MKDYTLEQVLNKLIRRNYVENKATIEIKYGNNTITTTRASLYREKNTLLLFPVTDVYVSIGDTLNKKRLLAITDSGIDYRVTVASIRKAVYEIYGNKLKDIYSGYTLTFVCQILPEAFVNSFLYQEKFIPTGIFLALMQYKNTIMNIAHYSKCIQWINEHKKSIIKQYRIKGKRGDIDLLTADELLADVLSIVAGFKIRIRCVHESSVDGYYVIEAA